MEYVLETENLTKRYGNSTALDHCSLRVPAGSIYGLFGNGGAGKTTLLSLICGLQGPSAGEYSIFGVKNTRKEMERVRRRMGVLVGCPSLYRDMTAAENLKLQYMIRGLAPGREMEWLLEEAGLSDAGSTKVGQFSMEMAQRLGFAMALAGEPDFLVLDEPLAGLTSQRAEKVRGLLLKLNRKRRTTVLISGQEINEWDQIVTDYSVLDQGHIVRQVERERGGGLE